MILQNTPPQLQIVRSGLVLWLDASIQTSYPGSGTTWSDLSGNGFNGALTAGITFNNSIGGNLVFPGNQDGVDCGNNFNFQNFTATVWLKTTNSTGYNFVLSTGSSPTPVISGWGLVCDSTNTISLEHCNVGNAVTYQLATLYNGQWVQLGVYRNSSNGVGIVVNGVIVATSIYAPTFTNSNLWIGKRPGGTLYNPYFVGNIAQTLMYDRALTASEITHNYNITKTRFGL
jgi:Concanavalin A-like lectin/glucanases superfamily